MKRIFFIVPSANADNLGGIPLQFPMLSIVSESGASLRNGLAAVCSAGKKYVISFVDACHSAGALLREANGLQGFVEMRQSEKQMGKQFF